MAIKGLTDQAAALPIIGVLRKGEKKPETGNRPGKDLTYFRFTSDDALAVKMFSEAYPTQEELRSINVFLPFKTTDENIDSWIEEWIAGGLVHRCDGENQVLWRNIFGGYETGSRPCEHCQGKQVGRLSVIVPELGRFATVTVLTTSIHDIINLTRQLRSYEAMTGDLRGIPFTLRRRAQKISTPDDKGKRVRREKWLLSIETQPRWTMLQLTAMERNALPAVDIIDSETGEVQPANKALPPGTFDPFSEAEYEHSPEPEPAKVEKGPAPTTADELLTLVDSRVQVTYNNVPHLFNAIRQELGGGWTWPEPGDVNGWRVAYDAAKKHADAKVKQPESQAEAEPAEDDKLVF